MSSAARPEFFLDRSLGRTTARLLREAGHQIHLIADFYPTDAEDVPDEEWIAEGCRRGWALLTKDQRIRYRAAELAALDKGHLFCLSSGNMDIAAQAAAFLTAMPKMEAAIARHPVGFWHVYRDGQLKKKWP